MLTLDKLELTLANTIYISPSIAKFIISTVDLLPMMFSHAIVYTTRSPLKSRFFKVCNDPRNVYIHQFSTHRELPFNMNELGS